MKKFEGTDEAVTSPRNDVRSPRTIEMEKGPATTREVDEKEECDALTVDDDITLESSKKDLEND